MPPRDGRSPTGTIPERQRTDRIFSRALDQPDAERSAFVARECAGDDQLRAAVLRLLQAERASRGAFEAGAAENLRAIASLLDEPVDAAADARIGQRLGPFRLIRRIGQGGMAVVYLGERDDGQFEQRVAVKLLRRTVDQENDIARFRTERQILSSLEHPNIARLIDGATTGDGLPFLVTEFVEGLPITEYCAAQGLDIEARLDLFLQVADAVHHAHQKLIVHRDIKPSNVMVDTAGRVRLLDFGIAKLVDPTETQSGAPRTRVGRMVMTPEYAAPEQVAGAGVTTVTDVYQLGVLLHELLTGARPAASLSGTDALLETVQRPSAVVSHSAATDCGIPLDSRRLARRLHGDIDVILQTALQQDPDRRYASAAAFSTDVRNHLRGLPITARPEGAVDLVRRVMRRRPFATASAGLAFALLVGWLVSLQFYTRELAHERDAAQAQSVRATRAYGLLLDLVRRADPLERDTVGGRGATVWDSLDATAESVRATLRNEPETLAELLDTLARLYRAGERPERSRELLLETLALQREINGPESPAVAITLGELGSIEQQLGETEAARAYLEQAIGIARRLPREQAIEAVPVFLDAGHTAIGSGDAQAALRHFEYAESLLRESPRSDPNDLIETLFGMGNSLRQLGQPAQAEALILESVRMTEDLYGAGHARLAGPLSALGNVQRNLGRYDLAAASLRRAIGIMVREYSAEDGGLLSARNNLALVLGASGDRRGEQAELNALIESREAAETPDQPAIADLYQNLGASLARSGDRAAALSALDKAQRIYDAHLPETSPRRAFPRLTRAVALLDDGQPDAAATAAEEAVAILETTLPAGHFATAIGSCVLAEALLDRGDIARAAPMARDALLLLADAPVDQAAYVARCRAVNSRISPAE